MSSKICRNCGFAFDGDDCCPTCGAPYEAPSVAPEAPEDNDMQEAPQTEPEPSAAPNQKHTPPLKRTVVVLCAAVCAVMIVCTAVLGVMIFSAKRGIDRSILEMKAEEYTANVNSLYAYNEAEEYVGEISSPGEAFHYAYGEVTLDKAEKTVIGNTASGVSIAQYTMTFTLSNTGDTEMELYGGGMLSADSPLVLYSSTMYIGSSRGLSIVDADFTGKNDGWLKIPPTHAETVTFTLVGADMDEVFYRYYLSNESADGEPYQVTVWAVVPM